MHGYSTDSDERREVPLFLALLAISLAWLSSKFFALIYQYQNQPLVGAANSMHMHFGTAMLRISEGGCLVGDYYSGRDRRTFGRICCRRQLANPKKKPETGSKA